MKKELLNLNGILHVRISFLEKYGFSVAAIHSRLSANRKGRTKTYEHHSDPNDLRVKWIKFSSIPARTRLKYNLPSEETILYEVEEEDINQSIQRIRRCLFHAYNDGYHHFFKHYHGIYYDHEVIENHARTHAVLHSCIDLKRFGILVKDIYEVYNEMTDLTFPGKSLKSFYHKLVEFETRGADSLIHGSQGKVKALTKVKPKHVERIEKLFRSPKMLSGTEITDKLNRWALENGFRKLSVSTVRRVISDPHFQNRNRPYRNGQEWVDSNFKPFRLRMNPEHNGELWQVDGSRLQIAYLNQKKNAPGFLHLFVVMDVHSRKIIGYSSADTENHLMVKSALRMAVKNTAYLPKQLLKDNGGCYAHKTMKKLIKQFQFSGCDVRSHAPSNARDKAHIERFIETLQLNVLKHYEGYVGEGIKSKRAEARPSREILKKNLTKANLMSRKGLEELIPEFINQYNELVSKKDNRSPRLRFEIGEFHKDLVPVSRRQFRLLFWEQRVKQIKNSMVILSEGSNRQKQFQYILEDEDLRLRLNLTDVLVCFDREFRDEISLYDQNESWICDVKRTMPVRIVRPKKTATKTSEAVTPKSVSSPNKSLRSRNNIFKQPATLDLLLIKTKNNE